MSWLDDFMPGFHLPVRQRMDESPQMINGTPIHVNDQLCITPKMQLSAKICEILKAGGQEDFITKQNHWMIDFFGCEEHIYQVNDPMHGKMIVMSSRAFAKLPKVSVFDYRGG